jgi:hypothetical protein
MKDRLHNLWDLARPLVAEVVTDARDTAGWVVDKGKAVVNKATDLSPIVIARKDTPVTFVAPGEYVWKPAVTNETTRTTTVTTTEATS